MDSIKQYIKTKRNKFVSMAAAFMAVGIILMCMDKTGIYAIKEQNEEPQRENAVSANEDMLELRLEQLLSMVEGAGQVKVMITYKTGREIVAAVDSTEDISKENDGEKTAENRKYERKLVLKENKEPVILKEVYPKPEGVLIVAQGGGNAETSQKLTSAAMALLNVDEHKIEVLKMK